jgi:translation initiation factor IF-2
LKKPDGSRDFVNSNTRKRRVESRIEMSESMEKEEKVKKPAGKPLSLSRPSRLELKKTVELGQVRQSFSHGRSKMVVVETRKKRTYAPDAGGRMSEVKADLRALALEAAEGDAAPAADSLTENERAARARALEDARHHDGSAPPEARPEAGPDPEDDARVKAEDDARRKAESDERHRKEEEAHRLEVQAKAAAAAAAAKLEAREEKGEEGEGRGRVRKLQPKPEQRHPGRKGEPRRRSGKLTIAEALEGGAKERTRSLASVKRAREKQKKQQFQPQNGKKIVRDVVVPETITVQELANRMAERGAAVIKALMQMGVMATINQPIDGDTAELVVAEFGHNIKRVSDADVEIGLKGKADESARLLPRPPVVTVMGHVDHGKTSLLDALRETDVASKEAGGITQHIGAYQVHMRSGRKITFIDTPGHEAFTDMRARGATVTDIVVLVVAADDGVMPQTIEAIHHAKAAKVPIIVAINKIDRPQADAGKVRTELLQHDIVLEEMGGEILSVEVSAKEKINLDKLEEVILLQAELLDLKANPERPAEGVVIESKMEQGRGGVATILIERGTLKAGDIFVAGGEWGRVRALADAQGNELKQAGPAMPVEVLGLNGIPAAGDDVVVVENEARAREVSEFRQRKSRDARAAAGARGTLEQMFSKIKDGEAEQLPVVVKADVHGSLEAILAALEKISTDEVKVDVLHSGIGGINESDVTLANASGALVLGFNVRANPQARNTAKRDGVEVRYYSIIYDLTDDLKAALSGMLAPEIKENLLGYAEIREVFNISKVGKVAGCMVTEGQVKRGGKVRLLRDDVVIHEGDLSQLKRFKDDVKEVKEGTECGIALANYNDIQAGDRVECFEVEEIARHL